MHNFVSLFDVHTYLYVCTVVFPVHDSSIRLYSTYFVSFYLPLTFVFWYKTKSRSLACTKFAFVVASLWHSVFDRLFVFTDVEHIFISALCFPIFFRVNVSRVFHFSLSVAVRCHHHRHRCRRCRP